jgi:predicted dienelactone hydrolase
MRTLLALMILLATACGSARGPLTGTAADTGFVVQGDPESASGATWTFRGNVDGVRYDLAGILRKPVGSGPFPAVVLSHGSEGSAAFFAQIIAPTMVQWGLVVIATNYTHSSGVPIGAPGAMRFISSPP